MDTNGNPAMTEQAAGIGAQLVAGGKLQQADLERALVINGNHAGGVGPLLVRLGLVSDQDLLRAYAERYTLPVLRDDEFPEQPVKNSDLPVKFLKEKNVVPVRDERERITLAITDPEDQFTLQAVALACGKPVTTKLGSLTQVERALEQLYGDGRSAMEDIVEDIRPQDEQAQPDSIEKLRDLAAEAPVIRLVNLIINRAVTLRASDIHIEPFADRLKVRYRVDGVLQESEAPPARSAAAVVSRVKIMANLNIAERRLPQDGRIQARVQGKLIDLRVSTVPTLYGESLALRILDKQRLELDLALLGFEHDAARRLNEILALPHGILLVTGPTGSGKTTTLYAALQTLNTPDRKILTVEDPVEYQLEGVNQIQVKPRIGLNFAGALRAIVRQDPDVIMIGEMRDLETARIAVQSALTGHLVFSTLHTNDAGSSITRLLDMGIEDYLLTSTLNGILAQRLVRALCRHCRKPYTPPPALVGELQLRRYDPGGLTLHEAVGCEACANSGYLGRTVISELLVMSEPLRQLILSRADGNQLQNAALAAGMDSMKADGLKKALRGVTTIEEVSRVIQG